MVIKFKLLSADAAIPVYSHEGDAGFDIKTTEDKELAPGEHYGFSTGLASEIPTRLFVKLFDRSGLAFKSGIHVLAGVIDSGYRGEWKVILLNSGSSPVKISKGDRIAQGVLFKIDQAEFEIVEELSESERAEGGFGSTGKK